MMENKKSVKRRLQKTQANIDRYNASSDGNANIDSKRQKLNQRKTRMRCDSASAWLSIPTAP